jgi:hypothetical protein
MNAKLIHSNPQIVEFIANEIDDSVLLIAPLAKDYISNMRTVINELF